MHHAHSFALLVTGLCVATGCAHQAPPELVEARAAYEHAASGIARQESPEDMHMAKQALEIAEATFELDGDSHSTRDRAYVAIRTAQLAEIRARIAQGEKRLAALEQSQRAQQQDIEGFRDGSASSTRALSAAEQQRVDAERRTEQLARELALIATVKQEPRGLVITLTEDVLFASGDAMLLPSAQSKLSEVADVLSKSDPRATIVVEGHTDSKGPEAFNLDLSARRAQVVRTYLAQHGVAPQRIRAQGLGFARPVSHDETAAGGANNRRIEIVVQSAAHQPPPSSSPEG